MRDFLLNGVFNKGLWTPSVDVARVKGANAGRFGRNTGRFRANVSTGSLMKIERIEAIRLEMPLAAPIADARNVITRRSAVLVRITTDTGLVGWGEAASFAGAGELVAHAVDFLGRRILGADATLIAQLRDRLYHETQHFGRRGVVLCALSGIDLALWDLLGKRAGLPVHKMLGAARDSIRFYFNAGYYDGESKQKSDDNLVRSVERAIERGSSGVKIKIGRYGYEDDAARIVKARELLGPSRDLMVDANACLDRRALQYLDDVCHAERVRWFEEPIPLQSIESMRELRQRLRTPIAGYELEMTLQGYAALLDARTVDIVQPDAIWSGGLTECVRIAGVAAAHNIELIPHNFASVVSLAANAHLAAIAPTGGWLEVDSNENPFLWELDANGAYELKDGGICIPDLPGFGIEPDVSRLSQYIVQ